LSLFQNRLWLVCLGLLVLTRPLSAQFFLPTTDRQDINLNTNWLFIQEDVTNAYATNFNDSAWTNINLPHTWDIPDGQSYPGSNYYEGIGWYRTYFTVGTNGGGGRGRGGGGGGSMYPVRYFLKFDGAFLVADVYVNGTFVGEHQGGFSAFVFDVTTNLIAGGATNVVAVKLNNGVNSGPTTNIPPLAGDFTFWGGIYRGAHLLVTDEVPVTPMDYGGPGLYLTTTSVSATSATVTVKTMITNATPSEQLVELYTYICDADTNIVEELFDDEFVLGGSSANIVDSAVLYDPELWYGTYDPYMYQAFVLVYGYVLSGDMYQLDSEDVYSQSFGIRSFSVDPTNGFSLNGASYDLHGVELPQDWLNSGWALTDEQRDTNFAFINEIGATAVRLPYFQHDDYDYTLADQNGIVVWSELPLIGALPGNSSNLLEQARELVKQEYNHPSIVCWGMYDDITNGAAASNLVVQLAGVVTNNDPTRFVTAASTNADNDPTTFAAHVIGFNKYYGWYDSPIDGLGAWADSFHANNPKVSVGISEYGAGGSIYQHTENPTEPTNTATNFHPEEWQNLVHETNWQMISARPWLWTKFVWNLFDYASDTRDEGDTPGRNDSGLVTYDRQTRKDAFYYYEANWTTYPMVYITGHTFTNRQSTFITAKVYANCGSVELFLNGISQGSVTSTNCIFTWPLTLLIGANNVMAIGTQEGFQVTDSLVWIGPTPPLTVVATPTNAQISLNWTPDPGAISYNIERGTSSGNENDTVASGVTDTNYTDSGLINGDPYYYVVVAIGANGPLASSAEVSATPFPPLNLAGTQWINTLTAYPQGWNASANWNTGAGFPNSTGAAAIIYDGITANQTITLNQPVTVGVLDMGVYGGSYNIAANGGSLTLDNTPAPASLVQLAASRGDTISAPLTVNGALNVTNASTNLLDLSCDISGAAGGITISGDVVFDGTNTYYGDLVIPTNGAVLTGNTNASLLGFGFGEITFMGGSLEFCGYGGGDETDWGGCSTPLNVPAGQTGTLLLPPVFGETTPFNSALTGGGTLNVVVDYVRDYFGGDCSGFTGRIVVSPRSGTGDFRIDNSSGYANAAIYLNNGVNLYNVNTPDQTTDLGELGGDGGAYIGPGSGAAIYPTWRIGAKNTTNTYAGVIADTGVTTLVKIGTGCLALSGPNTYSGGTTVSAGMLCVNNTTGSGTGAGAVTVDSRAVLGGAGAVAGAVTINSGGILAPGNPLGALTFGGSLSLAAGSTTVMAVSQTPPGNASVAVLGDLTIGGNLVVTNLGATELRGGDTFSLFSATNHSGTFASIVLPPLNPALAWNTSLLYTAGKLSVVTTTQPVIKPLAVSPRGLVFAGSNGVAGAKYYLLGSSNLAAPLADWIPVVTNFFDSRGDFNFTNPAPGHGQPQEFYLLELP
jgi:beta-galactosidase